MQTPSPTPKRSLADSFRRLRWRLTLSYTAVTVGAMLFIELLIIGIGLGALYYLFNSSYLPGLIIDELNRW